MAELKYEWLDEYCLAQMGATKDFKPEWDAIRYMVGGKMFAMCGDDKSGKPIITLKLDPIEGDMLRQQYEDVVPGYYMNKEHWNSLYLEGDVPDDVLKEMIRESHQLILKSLSKKLQTEITGKHERVLLMNEKVIQSSEYFGSGLYCSQAVLGAFSENYGIDKEVAFKISCGLNSGVRCADICGAVSGAVLVIGLKHGNDKAKCNSETEAFLSRFREKNGDIVCRNILGCDISTPDGKEEAANENLFNTVCMDMVVSAAQLLCDLGY